MTAVRAGAHNTDLLADSTCCSPASCCGNPGADIGGFGAGLYDAALSACPAALRVGLCPDAALREALPHEEHDEPMDLIVTPSEILVTAARPLGGAS